MENIIIEGQITATSKKNNNDSYKQEIPTKTVFLTVDETNAKKLEEFGLTKYTSKEEKKDFFMIKFPSDVVVYLPNGVGYKRPDLSRTHVKDNETGEYYETNNFKTPDDKPLKFNIIKGNHMNNDFFRLQAIRAEEQTDIEEIKPENPFGDEVAF